MSPGHVWCLQLSEHAELQGAIIASKHTLIFGFIVYIYHECNQLDNLKIKKINKILKIENKNNIVFLIFLLKS